MYTTGHRIWLTSRMKQWESGEGRWETGHPLERRFIYAPSKAGQCFQGNTIQNRFLFLFLSLASRQIWITQKVPERERPWVRAQHSRSRYVHELQWPACNRCRKDRSRVSLPRTSAEPPERTTRRRVISTVRGKEKPLSSLDWVHGHLRCVSLPFAALDLANHKSEHLLNRWDVSYVIKPNRKFIARLLAAFSPLGWFR